ncbi:MAG: dephospho-CoA kinase [Alistipes sp.]|nr:dephospho-CoA kinase [Alistipes sp.]
MLRIGITGGIGSGKSTVCRLLEESGISVYDSDARAKSLMNDDSELREAISAEFGAKSYNDEGLDRKYLASIVFSDPERLKRLDEIVHPAVRRDFRAWCGSHSDEVYVVLESAILFDAGFDGEVDCTVAVVAPRELRIERVCKRDDMTPEEVERRIARQMSDDELRSRADYTIVNISLDYLRSDTEQLDKMLRYEAHRRAIRN